MSLDEERGGRKIFLPCVEPILVLNIVLNSGLRGLTAELKKTANSWLNEAMVGRAIAAKLHEFK